MVCGKRLAIVIYRSKRANYSNTLGFRKVRDFFRLSTKMSISEFRNIVFALKINKRNIGFLRKRCKSYSFSILESFSRVLWIKTRKIKKGERRTALEILKIISTEHFDWIKLVITFPWIKFFKQLRWLNNLAL